MRHVMQEIKKAVLMIADQFYQDIHVLLEESLLQVFVLLTSRPKQPFQQQNPQLEHQQQLEAL